MTTIAPFGAWASPIAASDTVAGLVGFAEIHPDGEDLYWVELRPSEGGRQVLVRRDSTGAITDLTPEPWNVRTRVHEYGGGAVAVRGGTVVFSDFASQRLHLAGAPPRPITPEPPRPMSVRFADGRLLSDGSMICVRETHREPDEPCNELVRVDLESGRMAVLASGRDFYAAPRPSPDERRLAWLEWDHPNMPWDGTVLRVADLGPDGLGSAVAVAGGEHESIVQPEWDPSGALVYATDRTGWWNLERFDGERATSLFPMEADFGEPAWVFGRSTYGFLSDGRMLVTFWDSGRHRLALLSDGHLDVIETPFSDHARLVTDGQDTAWFVGYRPDAPTALIEFEPDSGAWREIRANPRRIGPEWMPRPEIVDFPTSGDATAHAVFYPPTNPRFEGPADARPPLIVQVHGGPTSHVFPMHSLEYAFWTSRGFAVVDVNYRGSTAFGRAYRRALEGGWGVVDVEDCMAAARHLARGGDVDGDRLAITGGSAGGYTALAALAFGDAFSAGASYYGVADVELLRDHTHKFESRYLDRLIGTDREVMRRRSPRYSAHRITVPVILFQGLEDRVVPPEQAEAIADALRANGIPHALITYEGEDHGFRKAENLVHSLESELVFYGRVFGFRPAGDLPEITIVGDLG